MLKWGDTHTVKGSFKASMVGPFSHDRRTEVTFQMRDLFHFDDMCEV